MPFDYDPDYTQYWTYRERGSINLTSDTANAVRLRVICEVVQSPLAPYVNKKFNPESTWYGTVSFLSRGALIERRQIEPTACIIYDRINEHFLRRLDMIRMANAFRVWIVAFSGWVLEYQNIVNQIFLEGQSPGGTAEYQEQVAQDLERATQCVLERLPGQQPFVVDAFPFEFDQMKFVFPPETQFQVRLEYWISNDYCGDGIPDTSMTRNGDPDPFASGSVDPYATPRQSPGGSNPFQGLPDESPRDLDNNPLDYSTAPTPVPTGRSTLSVVGTFTIRNYNGEQPTQLTYSFGPFDEPYSYAWVYQQDTQEPTPRPMYQLVAYLAGGSTQQLITGVLSHTETITKVPQ